ncbi:hypothetical protein CL633_03495 [bacterium]|nr:hypothetical protein [bacterium]
MIQSIKKANLANKRVLLRLDFNGFWRLKMVLPTIHYLLTKKVKKIIIIGHIGRPKGKISQKFSLMRFKKCLPHGVELRENLRFDLREVKNDLSLAKELASLADIFVNESFSVCHRKHASIVGIPNYLPSYAGLILEQEIKVLNKKFKRPIIYIIGGAKVETKLPLAKILLKKCDHMLLGGLIANVVLENHQMEITSTKVHLPVDAVCYNKTCAVGAIEPRKILDIGPDTVALFSDVIGQAKTIIWNGPMGMFENKKYQQGTLSIAKKVASSNAYSIIGGGETIFALEKLRLVSKINHISIGGGALLDYLAKNKLPGIEALSKRS